MGHLADPCSRSLHSKKKTQKWTRICQRLIQKIDMSIMSFLRWRYFAAQCLRNLHGNQRAKRTSVKKRPVYTRCLDSLNMSKMHVFDGTKKNLAHARFNTYSSFQSLFVKKPKTIIELTWQIWEYLNLSADYHKYLKSKSKQWRSL